MPRIRDGRRQDPRWRPDGRRWCPLRTSSVRLDVDTCLRGEALNGDDFTDPKPTRWYEDGPIADGDIWREALTEQGYRYNALNRHQGLGELRRCLAWAGHALLRDSVASMDHWHQPRTGLISKERGLLLHWLRPMLAELGFEVIHQALRLHRLTNLVAPQGRSPASRPPSRSWGDDLLCGLTASWLIYHATTLVQKLRPTTCSWSSGPRTRRPDRAR